MFIVVSVVGVHVCVLCGCACLLFRLGFHQSSFSPRIDRLIFWEVDDFILLLLLGSGRMEIVVAVISPEAAEPFFQRGKNRIGANELGFGRVRSRRNGVDYDKAFIF